MPRIRIRSWCLALLPIAACRPPATALARQPETAAPPLVVLHALRAAEGLSVRGALTAMDGRWFGMAGEADGAFCGVTFGTSQVFRFSPPAGACQ